jgi:hypothetical protein
LRSLSEPASAAEGHALSSLARPLPPQKDTRFLPSLACFRRRRTRAFFPRSPASAAEGHAFFALASLARPLPPQKDTPTPALLAQQPVFSAHSLEPSPNPSFAPSSQCRPGTLYRDLGNKITKRATKSNCSVVKTYCGHGIGNLFHTSPNVPHYAKNKAKGVMKKGHVFTVEPMINLGSYEDFTWGDNWTAVTMDGKVRHGLALGCALCEFLLTSPPSPLQRSAQFEHTVVVTDNGIEILTARDDEPVMLWDAAKNSRQ